MPVSTGRATVTRVRFATGATRVDDLSGEAVTSDDRLDGWIDALRNRLARGDLAVLPPIELGHGTRRLTGEVTVRIMLADLQDLTDSEGSAARDSAWRQERLASLRDDFRRLRAMLG
jgi:hypothetical protein